MTEDDIGLWTDIERDAEPYVSITDSLFRREFGHDLDAIQRRCFILTDPAGLGVGTVSAWYDRDFLGEDYGRIHWVAVRPSCQGKGLGKASLTYAMNVLSQWHTKSYLVTSAERLPAIQMYLDFGFVPHFQHAYAQALWDDIQLRLKSARMD